MKLSSGYSIIIAAMICLFFTNCQKETFINPDPPVANAGNSQTIQLPVNTVTLSGSGVTSNGSITGYIWTLVSGPNIPAILSPGSATTVVNSMVAGNYIFQLLVTDSIGLTDVDTTSVLVRAAPQQTFSTQPANSSTELTMYQTALNGNYSDPASPESAAVAWTSGGGFFNARGIIKFDLSTIPANSTIVSAKLTLYSNPAPLNGNGINANFGTNNSMYIQRATSAWNAATVWTNQPSVDAASQISIPHTNLSVLDLTDVDVTNMIAAMISVNNNYGFVLRLQNEVTLNSRVFCSSRYSDAAKRPKLVIVYQ